MSEIVVETTASETVISIDGGPELTTTVAQELQTVIETPAEPIVIDLNSGARGEPGSAILTGPAYPTLAMGTVGDIYIVTEGDVAAGFVFKKTSEAWEQTGTVRGPAGGINTINGYGGPDVTLEPIDLGLERVDNTNDLEKPVSTATQTALDDATIALTDAYTDADSVLMDEINTKEDILVAGTVGQYYRGDKTWAILDKAAAGLGNVDNTSDVAKPISTATQSALDLKAPIASPTFTGTVGGITKTMVGLGNVDNTSDANKPVSTAQQTALDTKVTKTGDETIAGVKTFTSSPIVPDPTIDTQVSTKKYVDDTVASLVDSSPETLNTLNELAAALGDDPNFATTTTNAIAAKVSLTGDETIADVKTFSSAPVVPDASWTIAKTSGLQGALDLKAPLASPTFTGTITGNGSGLTSLNGSNVSTGTIADGRLSTNIPKLDIANTFTGRVVVSTTNTGTTYSSAPLEVRADAASIPRISFHKSTVNAGQLRMTNSGSFEFANIDNTALASVSAFNITAAGTISGMGSGITTINGSNISSGTVAEARVDAAIARLASPAFTGTPTAPTQATTGSDTQVATSAFVKAALLAANPVGSIVFNVSNANPSTYIGGTWTAWGGGRVPVGVGSGQFAGVETLTGDATSVLTASHIPQHTHTIAHGHTATTAAGEGGVDHLHYVNLGGGGHEHTYEANVQRQQYTSGGTFGATYTGTASGTWGGGGHGHEGWSGAADRSLNHGHTITVSGSNTANSGPYGTASPTGVPIVQPSITVYMWKRTA